MKKLNYTLLICALLSIAFHSLQAQGPCYQLTPSQSPNSRCSSGSFTFWVDFEGNAVAAGYTWYEQSESGWDVVSGGTNSFTTPELTVTKSYYVDVDLGFGCPSQQYFFTGQINTPTAPPAVYNASLCGFGTGLLRVEYLPGYTYTWYEAFGEGNELVNDGSVGMLLSTGQAYSIGGSGGSELTVYSTSQSLDFFVVLTPISSLTCGGSTVSVSLTVHPNPLVSASAPSSLCVNAAPVLLSSSPSGGTWSGAGVSGNYFNPQVAGAGSHYVSYTYYDDHGCVGIASANISVGPSVTVSGALTCNRSEIVDLNTMAFPQGGTWSGAFVDSANKVFRSEDSGPGEHTISYTYTANGCTVVKSATIQVASEFATPFPYSVSQNSYPCGGGVVTLSVMQGQGEPENNFNYIWSDAQDIPYRAGNGQFMNSLTHNTPYITQSTGFFIRAVNASGCQSEALPVTALIEAPPALPVLSVVPNCTGTGMGRIRITNEQQGILYKWYDQYHSEIGLELGEGINYNFTNAQRTELVVSGLEPQQQVDITVAAVKLTSGGQCASGEMACIIAPAENPESLTSQNQLICGSGGTVTLTASGTGVVRYEWYPSTYNAQNPGSPWKTGATIETDYLTATSRFYVLGYNEAGCPLTQSVDVIVSAYPQPPVAASVSACAWEPVSLSGTPPEGSSINWYRATQTAFFAQGQSVQDQPRYATGTFTYQAESVNSLGCTSTSKTPVTVTVPDNCDQMLNYVGTLAYDSDGSVVGATMSYYDDRGKLLQTQTKLLTDQKLIVSQNLEDEQGRTVLSALSAPVDSYSYKYRWDFITGTDGKPYTFKAFDLSSNQNTPLAIDQSRVGSQGWYYSSNNTLEPLTPQTNFPYARTVFYKDGSNEVMMTAAPGESLRLGSGHEALSGTFPVVNELSDYLSVRNTLALPGLSTVSSLGGEAVQSVGRDQNGNYAISISMKDGKAVMSARAGTPSEYTLHVQNEVVASADPASAYYRGAVYFYILNDQAVTINTTGTYQLINNVTEAIFTPGATWPQGFYRIIPITGETTVSYTNYYLDVSYQFYDNAGRLTCSLSPNGYQQLKSGVNYSAIDKTVYTYNHRGWLLEMTEPDAGTTRYMYRKDGKIRFSENAVQRAQGKFSYTHYDRQGRPVESGEYAGGNFPFQSESLKGMLEQNFDQLPAAWSSASCRDWVRTHYDYAATAADMTGFSFPAGYSQTYLAAAVSWTENSHSATFYSYDELGRVRWMMQRPKPLVLQGVTVAQINKSFVTTYLYDFLGNVLTAQSYAIDNAGTTATGSAFYHHYQYDADKRLTTALTSTDGVNKTQRAKYYYYLHGPLKRVELGDKLQGIDFVYNINGWLTQINHPDTAAGADPGGDGESGAHSAFRKDAFGMQLQYYENVINPLLQVAVPKDDPRHFHRLPQMDSSLPLLAEANTPSGTNIGYLKSTLAGMKKFQ